MTTSTGSSNLPTALWEELARRNPNDPHAWRMAHRRLAGRPLRNVHALADIARDLHPLVVMQKGAQMGGTELGVDLALWVADTAYAGRGNALVLMPTADQMGDFAQARFDRAIQDSPYLRSRLQPEPPRRKGADSKRLKRIGAGYIFLRGAESARQVASVDADLVLLDEFDQMDPAVLDLALRRIASSAAGLIRVVSTPRYPEAGINRLYLQSDQRRYHIPCLACGESQSLTWEANVDRDRALVVCRACRAPLDTTRKGEWVPAAPGNTEVHGYQLSRLYSPWLNLPQMIEASAATTPSALQEFHNSDLGETFAPPGGGLTAHDLDHAQYDYGFDEYPRELCVMGVDVGTKFHVVIRRDTLRRVSRPDGGGWERIGKAPLWCVAELDTIAEVEALRTRFNVQRTVIDAQPELHLVRAFALTDPKRIFLARYHQSPTHEHTIEYGRPSTLVINRTAALDATFERFRTLSAPLPRDARALGGQFNDGMGEYYRQLRAPQRTLLQDSQGNWVSRWLDHGRADHYAHAEVYAWAADHLTKRGGSWFTIRLR